MELYPFCILNYLMLARASVMVVYGDHPSGIYHPRDSSLPKDLTMQASGSTPRFSFEPCIKLTSGALVELIIPDAFNRFFQYITKVLALIIQHAAGS